MPIDAAAHIKKAKARADQAETMTLADVTRQEAQAVTVVMDKLAEGRADRQATFGELSALFDDLAGMCRAFSKYLKDKG